MMQSPWPCRQMNSQPRLPFPGRSIVYSPVHQERTLASAKVNTEKILELERTSSADVYHHLGSVVSLYPGLLEEYVVNNVGSENISRWLTKRKTYEARMRGSESSISKPITFSEIVQDVDDGEFLDPIYSLAKHLCRATHSSGFNLYGIGGYGKTLILYSPGLTMWDPSGQRSVLISTNSTVAGYSAFHRVGLCVEDVQMDPRFPKRIGLDVNCKQCITIWAHRLFIPYALCADPSGVAVLCLPIILPNDDLVGVVEFYRSWRAASYTPQDLEFVKTTLEWTAIAIHKSAVCNSLHQQTEMNNFLLDVCRTYLDDITDFEHILEHIMRFAKSLVYADRCSLFLYDKESKELYSNLFDTGEEEDGKPVFEKRNEIRFGVGKGIAGCAASIKKVLNVSDVYGDSRFNREVDKITGYTTNNILCIPIVSDGEVYGVVQMINKQTGGCFTKLDEENFNMFSIFCALALKYSRTHTRLQEEHNKYHVVLEQFHRSMACSHEEAMELTKRIAERQIPVVPYDFDRFYFSLFKLGPEIDFYFSKMIHELCAPDIRIDTLSLVKFTLTVKQNYHDLPYHNWKHALAVTHTMYCILKRHSEIFTKLERLGLLVACLAHDIDHRSVSNQYLRKIEHPLAALYPTSTMERHHCGMLTTILNQKGHNVLASLDKESAKFVLDLAKHTILQSDLHEYFSNHRSINELLLADEFDVDNTTHRHYLYGIMMTASDLSSTAKDWETTKSIVYDLYKEFWAEGDLRRKRGFSFVDMMDRTSDDDVPSGQIGFYTNVSIRCYEILAQILPDCDDLLTLSYENLENWRKEAERAKERKARKELESRKSSERPEVGVMLKGGMWVMEDSFSDDVTTDTA